MWVAISFSILTLNEISNRLMPGSRHPTSALFHTLRSPGALHADAEVPRLLLKLAAILNNSSLHVVGCCQGGGGAGTNRDVGLS